MHYHIQQYIAKGYVSVHVNTSNIGGQVLRNRSRVVKFGQDSSYAEYVSFVQSHAPLNCFPVIYSHTLPHGPFIQTSNMPYTVTEMEFLQPLNPKDKLDYEAWISSEIKTIGTGGNAASDPFRLEYAIRLLILNAQAKKINLDLLKGDNIMQRPTGQYVITDPYN